MNTPELYMECIQHPLSAQLQDNDVQETDIIVRVTDITVWVLDKFRVKRSAHDIKFYECLKNFHQSHDWHIGYKQTNNQNSGTVAHYYMFKMPKLSNAGRGKGSSLSVFIHWTFVPSVPCYVKSCYEAVPQNMDGN